MAVEANLLPRQRSFAATPGVELFGTGDVPKINGHSGRSLGPKRVAYRLKQHNDATLVPPDSKRGNMRMAFEGAASVKKETFTVAIIVATACVVPLMLYKATTHPETAPVAMNSSSDTLEDVSFDFEDAELTAPSPQAARQSPQ